MSAKFSFLITALFIFIYSSLMSQSYKMTISDVEVLSSTKIQANVYIENVGEDLILTSYQCALSINQNIDLSYLSLTYVAESSELINEPNLFVGVENIDGPTELTFVSYIGNDIVSTKTRVGTFIIEGNDDISQINLLNIHWDFEGTIATIITGDKFLNITNPSSHSSILSDINIEFEKLNIVNVTASSTTDTNTSPLGTIDGKGFDDGDQFARWATTPMPAFLIFDLGEEKLVSKTRFSFFNFDKGRIYQYSLKSSTDNMNWTEVLQNVSSKEKEWSEESFEPINCRYVRLEFNSSSNNSGKWANLWEAEIYGNNITDIGENDINEELQNLNDVIPSEYGISQNYPNPFNPSTNVEIYMKKNENVKLNVYNLLGERVIGVIDGELSAGIHEINIDGSKLASGMYIYQLVIGNEYTESNKMQLMK